MLSIQDNPIETFPEYLLDIPMRLRINITDHEFFDDVKDMIDIKNHSSTRLSKLSAIIHEDDMISIARFLDC